LLVKNVPKRNRLKVQRMAKKLPPLKSPQQLRLSRRRLVRLLQPRRLLPRPLLRKQPQPRPRPRLQLQRV